MKEIKFMYRDVVLQTYVFGSNILPREGDLFTFKGINYEVKRVLWEMTDRTVYFYVGQIN